MLKKTLMLLSVLASTSIAPVFATEQAPLTDKVEITMSFKEIDDNKVALDVDISNKTQEEIPIIGIYQTYNVEPVDSEKREMKGFDFQYSILSDDKLLHYRANSKLTGTGQYRTIFDKIDVKDGLETEYSIHEYLQPDDEIIESLDADKHLAKGRHRKSIKLRIGDVYSSDTGIKRVDRVNEAELSEKRKEAIKNEEAEENAKKDNFNLFIIGGIALVTLIAAIFIVKYFLF